MPARQPAPERHVDSDGVVRVEQRRASGAAWVLGLGIALACAGLGLSAWLAFDEPEVEGLLVGSPTRPTPRPTPTPPPTRPAVRQVRPVKPAAAPELPKHLQEQLGEVPEEALAQLPEGLYEMPKPGERPTGMMLFPAPGTDPPKRGIIVPEGFELPPGYVRHYQTTDDGELLPAILMFSPDKPPLDASGQPMKVPENRIVTPELAPPGMPVHMLDPEQVEQRP